MELGHDAGGGGAEAVAASPTSMRRQRSSGCSSSTTWLTPQAVAASGSLTGSAPTACAPRVTNQTGRGRRCVEQPLDGGQDHAPCARSWRARTAARRRVGSAHGVDHHDHAGRVAGGDGGADRRPVADRQPRDRVAGAVEARRRRRPSSGPSPTSEPSAGRRPRAGPSAAASGAAASTTASRAQRGALDATARRRWPRSRRRRAASCHCVARQQRVVGAQVGVLERPPARREPDGEVGEALAGRGLEQHELAARREQRAEVAERHPQVRRGVDDVGRDDEVEARPWRRPCPSGSAEASKVAKRTRRAGRRSRGARLGRERRPRRR